MGHLLSRYNDALAFLFARTTGKSKFGLERTEALLSILGDPHRRLRVFHVAGTNGKGSVCATLDAQLQGRGFRVGKYTSPHLVDFRERFLVDGQPVAEEFVVEFIDRHVDDVERVGATFFEATTAMAFDWFVRQGVDVAVVEAGLGGRLDSTNVVQPLVAGVTSIGIDHVEYLGETREEIAFEKAGIFKRGAAAVIGEPDEQIASLLAAHAEKAGASSIVDVWRTAAPRNVGVDAGGTHFEMSLAGESAAIRTPLAGAHQASNSAVALAMLAAAGEPWYAGLRAAAAAMQNVSLPGRFQRLGKYIFDVAHNPDGAAVLASTVAAVDPARPLVAVLCVLADKDWRGIMRALAPAVDAFVLTDAPTAPASRAWRDAEPLEFARANGWSATLEDDFDQALALAANDGATVLVTGSFHTVGDAMSRLQVSPLAR
jgi:dihydrofolate synthase/folylpolyglutamate synthase